MSKHPRHPKPGRPQITIVSDGTTAGTTIISADGQDLSSVLPISRIEIDIDPEDGPIAKIYLIEPIIRVKTDNILLHPHLFKVT